MEAAYPLLLWQISSTIWWDGWDLGPDFIPEHRKESPFLPTMCRPSQFCQAWSEELPPWGGIEQVSLVEVDGLPTIWKEVEGADRRHETHVPWGAQVDGLSWHLVFPKLMFFILLQQNHSISGATALQSCYSSGGETRAYKVLKRLRVYKIWWPYSCHYQTSHPPFRGGTKKWKILILRTPTLEDTLIVIIRVSLWFKNLLYDQMYQSPHMFRFPIIF